jgi:hypothetical protein
MAVRFTGPWVRRVELVEAGHAYKKVCADHWAEVEQWEIDKVGESIVRCGICHPTGGAAAQRSSTKQAKKPVTAATVTEERFVIHGPTSASAVVEAWAADYIRFERRPPWQDRLRNEIRSRCGEFNPSPKQVLHAMFCGAKLANADVENLTIYNIGSFEGAGRNGIRFEHGDTVPEGPGGAGYRFSYRYALASRLDSFAHWQKGQPLASFDWTDLGAFAGDKKLAQVWLALSRGEIEVFKRAEPETPFGVRVEVRPPYRRQPGMGRIGKGNLRRCDLRLPGPHRRGGPDRGCGTTSGILSGRRPSGRTRRDRTPPAGSTPRRTRRCAATGLPLPVERQVEPLRPFLCRRRAARR